MPLSYGVSITRRGSGKKWYGPHGAVRELKMIAVLTESTLDKLLQDGAAMVVEKFKRTRSLSLES